MEEKEWETPSPHTRLFTFLHAADETVAVPLEAHALLVRPCAPQRCAVVLGIEVLATILRHAAVLFNFHHHSCTTPW
jgi:hypothetical protein